jgi:hypothetical protein
MYDVDLWTNLNVVLTWIQRWIMVDEIGNLISTLFQRRNSNVDPICIVNPFSTSIQRLEGHFQRWFNVG